MNQIVVTGDNGGLGSKICSKILEETSNGVIGLSRHSNEAVVRLGEKFGDRYCHIDFDLSASEEIKQLYRSKIRPLGNIVGLVNNAACAYDDIVTNLQLEPLEKMFKINVYAPMMLTKYAIRDMLVSNIKGSIIHVSSVSAHTGYKGLAMYASTKGALEAFSKNVAREWGVKGIRSNVVAPGFMETAISEKLTDEQREKIYQRTSLKEATSIDSVADTIVFLLSDKAMSITGAVVSVDNGTV